MKTTLSCLALLFYSLVLSTGWLMAGESARKAEAKNVKLISYLDLGPNGTGTQILMFTGRTKRGK